jgi:hypothetical protein
VLLGIEPTRLRQLHRHTGESPSGLIGDCYRTVIACLLGATKADDLPHFVEDTIRAGLDQEGGWEDIAAARRWLRANEGIDLAAIDRDQADTLGCAYQLVVRSKTGPWNHSVVGRRGEVIWCPSTGDGDDPGSYTIADGFDDEPVLVLCEKYDPDPDELLAQWRVSSREGDGT